MSTWSEAERAGRIAGATLTDRPLRLRTYRCACGGEIVADVADPSPQVARHNETVGHLRWAWRNGLEEEWRELWE